MSNEIALIPTKEEFEIIQMMSKAAADSKHFDKMGGVAAILSVGLYAKEIGIPIMTALHGGLVPVMGKITMSAEMMNSLIRQKGHRLEILESNDKICRIKGTRKDTGETYTAQFSIEDAKRAGLIKGGGGYEKHADDMLFARCISKLKRRIFPDIATKAYVHGEIEEEDEPKKEAKKEDPIEVETVVIEDWIGELKKKYAQHSPDMVTAYAEACAKKKNISPEAFAKDCIKAPVLFDNFFDAWLAKQSASKPKSMDEVAQIDAQE